MIGNKDIISWLKTWGSGKETIHILPWPPSVNHYWMLIPMGKSVRMIVGKKGKEFREKVKSIIGETECKKCKLSVDILVCQPDRRKRDLDNLLKATLDALQHAGVYEDDSQVDRILITRSDEIIPGGEILVCIQEINNE